MRLKKIIFYIFSRAIQEKSHLYKEELEAKKKQIEKLDKKLIDLELEKLVKFGRFF